MQAIEPLVAGAIRSEPDGLEALLRATRPLVYRWALVRTGDPDDAEDLTQRVLLSVSTKLPAFEARARFTTWLYRVTQNAATEMERRRGFLRRLQQRWRAHALIEAEAARDPLDEVGSEQLRRNIDFLLRRLPLAQRQVFDLIDLQGFAPAEVAEMLSMKPGTVRVNLLRARRAMRRHMLQQDFASPGEGS
jgi:RNA polymerase sigma-70 factor (ECF subfamily)